MNCKKCIVLCILLTFGLYMLSAQVSVSPDDDFYSDATGWVLKGYVERLPLIKPYPLNVIRSVLDEVAEKGSETDRLRAEFYLKKYFSHSFRVSSATSADVKLKQVDSGGDDDTNEFEADSLFSERLSFFCDRQITPLFGIGADIGAMVRNNDIQPKDALPRFTVNTETNVVRPLKIESSDADFLLDPNVIATFGTQSLYASFGINKSGYGLFPDDSLILNPSAYQMLNAVFNYSGKHFSYSQLFGLMGASSYTDTDSYSCRKFLSFHSLKIPVPKTNVSVGLYESVVFSNPFMPAYFMPVPYFIIANVAGFNENVLSGIQLEWKPFPCLALSADLLLDDFDAKQVLKLKLNDGGIRAGFKTGFVYSPLESFCDFISLSYTLVTPYAYTKYNTLDDTYNYLDYTNFGQSLGTDLLPDSDRVSMTIQFKPRPNFRLGTITSFIRHANAYESLDDEDVLSLHGQYAADGSINMDTQGISYAADTTDFLKQDNLMYVIQAAVFGEYEFVTSRFGRLSVSVQYTFEYIKNDGVDNSIFSGAYETPEAVKADRERWENALHDSYNHYFSVGIKYTY